MVDTRKKTTAEHKKIIPTTFNDGVLKSKTLQTYYLKWYF